jgi:peptidoglycan L-alanyl-D-glutamate endopeptidase CwlK
MALYAKGRSKPGKIVTYKDGVERRSYHQTGNAVDVVPYPISWGNIERFRQFGWFVKGVATTLKRNGQIDSDVTWGGDWTRFKDYPHFEIR